MGQQLGVERQGGDVVASLKASASVALDLCLDDGDGAQAQKAGLAWEPPGSDEPVNVATISGAVGDAGAGSRRPSTQAVKHSAKSAPSIALMTSLRVSWPGTPAL